MSKPEPLAGGGGDLRNISKLAAIRIQHIADRYQATIHLVGSRAAGTGSALSDYDYVITGSHRIRNSAKYFLPRGPRVGLGAGIDIFPGPLDAEKPYITFVPDHTLPAEA